MEVSKQILLEAKEKCSNESFNKTTILSNGAGQYVGNIGELCFITGLKGHNLKYMHVGDKVYDYDFVVEGVTIDIKTKDRNVDASMKYNAHVNAFQKNLNCFLYVFANYNKKKNEIEYLGFITKKEYWQKCTHYKNGQTDKEGFKHKSDCGVLQYKNLRPIKELTSYIINL
jgi:hypothetical protein